MNNYITEHEQDKKLAQSASISRAGVAALFITNGALTFSYGFTVVLMALWPWATTLPRQSGAVIMATLTGLFCVLMLDGGRYLWEKSHLADNTTGQQQLIARVMEGLSFGGSVIASAISFRLLFSQLGLFTISNAETSQVLLAGILVVYLIGHMIAAFVFKIMSPEAKQLRSLSALRTRQIDDGIRSLEIVHKASQNQAMDYLARYHQEIQEKKARAEAERLLGLLGHGEIGALPDHHKAPEISPAAGTLPGPPPYNVMDGDNWVDSTPDWEQARRALEWHKAHGAKDPHIVNGDQKIIRQAEPVPPSNNGHGTPFGKSGGRK